MTGPLLFTIAFVAMEGVSYATHRWVMHGVGMAWHRSHHAPSTGGVERNDLFPVCFSLVGFGAFLAAALTGSTSLFWVAAGITAYGAAYLFVHEVHIHRRVSVTVPRVAYLEWLREAHRDHHLAGGEPYGMLLPLVRDATRRERAASTRLTRRRL
jgi:beta-carotene 3-hydroxylase